VLVFNLNRTAKLHQFNFFTRFMLWRRPRCDKEGAFHSNCFVLLTAITSGRAGASRSALPGGTLRIRLGLTGRGSQARQGLRKGGMCKQPGHNSALRQVKHVAHRLSLKHEQSRLSLHTARKHIKLTVSGEFQSI
jgi:hypothetical protein